MRYLLDKALTFNFGKEFTTKQAAIQVDYTCAYRGFVGKCRLMWACRNAMSLLLAAHMVMWIMSDLGIPCSNCMMQGFGVNTRTLLNAENQHHFVEVPLD